MHRPLLPAALRQELSSGEGKALVTQLLLLSVFGAAAVFSLRPAGHSGPLARLSPPAPYRMQVSLTDHRQQSAVDLSALLAAGFQMLTITLSAENPAVRRQAAPPSLLQLPAALVCPHACNTPVPAFIPLPCTAGPLRAAA